jgi:hypothetical protein
MSIPVLILTCNEESIPPECLETTSWSDDIIVPDSFGTDRAA